MFASGPANATIMPSRRGFLKLRAVTGTGLAQPNKKPPENNRNMGTNKVPIGSMCLAGFKLKRPSIFAVGSPSLYAA